MKKCNNPNHKNMGVRMATNELICLNCRDEQMKKDFEERKEVFKNLKGKKL